MLVVAGCRVRIVDDNYEHHQDTMEVAVVDVTAPDSGIECPGPEHRKNNQKLPIFELFRDFAQNTTLHGLRYITEAGLTAAEKIFWIVTFVISVVLCFFLMGRVWHKWWFSPVIVSFNERLVSVTEVPFPSVTICPQWKFLSNKNSPYNYSISYEKYFKTIYPVQGFRKMRPANSTEDIEQKEKLEDVSLICKDVALPFTNRNMSDESVVKNIYEISPKYRMIFRNSFCKWRKEYLPCNFLFRKVFTKEGVCYNFNPIHNNTGIIKQDRVKNKYLYLYTTSDGWMKYFGNKTIRGQEHVLKPDLEFELSECPEQSDTLCNSFYDGFKIYLQHPDDMPQASVYHYAAFKGQVSSLAIKFSVFNTSRKLQGYSAEQRQCYFEGDRELQYFKIYTYNNCRLECLSLYTYKKCGCVWFHMPHSNSSEICTARKSECVISAQADLASNNMVYDMGDRCTCLPRCESVQYDAELMKTNYDFKRARETYLKSIGWNKKDPNGNQYIFSRVELFFKESQSVAMFRSELFGLTDFMANCGGLLGLFLGFSFLSLVEVVYFSTLRLWRILRCDIKPSNQPMNDFSENIHQKT